MRSISIGNLSSFIKEVTKIAKENKIQIEDGYKTCSSFIFLNYLENQTKNYGHYLLSKGLLFEWINGIAPEKDNSKLVEYLFSSLEPFIEKGCFHGFQPELYYDEKYLEPSLNYVYDYFFHSYKFSIISNRFLEHLIPLILKKEISNLDNIEIADFSIDEINIIYEMYNSCRKSSFSRYVNSTAAYFMQEMINISKGRNIEIINENILLDGIAKKYDCLISIPSFEIDDRNDISLFSESLYPEFPDTLKSNPLWKKAVPLLASRKDNGIIALVLPERSAFESDIGSIKMREYLIENKLIKSIYTLPEKVFSQFSASRTVLYILGNNDGKTKLIDIERAFSDLKNVTTPSRAKPKEIFTALDMAEKNSEYITEFYEKSLFNVTKYLYKKNYSCRTEKLGELLESLVRGVQIPNIELQRQNSNAEETNYRVLSNSDIEDCIIKDTAKRINCIDIKYEKFCISEPDVLILSKMGPTFKVGISECVNGEKYLVTSNLFILRVKKEKVNPYYLLYFLNSSAGKELLKNNSAGSNVPTLSNDDVRNLDIPLPDMKSQNLIEEKMKIALEEFFAAKELYKTAQNMMKDIDEVFYSVVESTK